MSLDLRKGNIGLMVMPKHFQKILFLFFFHSEQKHASKDRYDSILAKVNQFYITGKPWEDCPDSILKHPIPREQWLIKNDDVVLEMELGKVSH